MVIKVLITDDHPVVREGLRAILTSQADMHVVGEAANGLEAISKARELKPDIILMDLRMPVLDGIAAMHDIRAKNPDIKFVVLTTYDDDEYVFGSIEAGACAYIFKDSPPEELFGAIRSAYSGESVIEPVVANRILCHFATLYRQTQTTGGLSERTLEVLILMARGMGNKEIATNLAITESTVKSHIQCIFQKLGVNSRTKAVTKAIMKGMIRL